MSKEFLKRFLSTIFLLPLTFYIVLTGNFLFNSFIFICFLISFFEWYKFKNNIFLKFLGFIFIIYSFYSILKIRNYFPENDKNIYFFLLILTICIFTDIGGYTFGKIFKGPKFSHISPNKTYSGLFGSFILSFIASILYLRLNSLMNYSQELNISMIFFILIVSAVSQCGDLIISYFKRKSNLKDTGNLIPGHGGLLDRIDGMIFVFPFIKISINLFNF